MWTKEFLVDVAERAIKTAAQSLLGLVVGNATILNVDWKGALVVAASAAVSSVLSSLASSKVGNPNTAAFLKK